MKIHGGLFIFIIQVCQKPEKEKDFKYENDESGTITTANKAIKIKLMEILNSNITINVKDLNDSIKFYEKIGFSLKQQWDNHYAQMNAPGIELGLHPSDASVGLGNRDGISIGFTTRDFEKTKNELSKLNISVTERSEEGGDFLHFNDPDGTSLYFIRSKW